MNIYATQHVQIDVTAMERVVKTMFVNVVMDLQIQIALVGYAHLDEHILKKR